MSGESRHRSTETRRRSRIGLGLSLALHLALAGTIMLLPGREERADDTTEHLPVEIVVLDDVHDAMPSVEEVDAAEVPPAETEAPPPEGERHPDPVADDPARQPDPPQEPVAGVAPNDAETAEPATSTQEPEPGGEGLALSGLRKHGRATTGAAVHTAESAGTLSQRTELALRESAPSSTRSDRAPRSLAEAGFERRRNGRLVYRDPEGKFKAILHDDGRVEFKNKVAAFERGTGALPEKVGMPGMSEAIRSAQDNELYRAEKKRLLEETFELRLSLAVDFAQRRIEAQLDRLVRDLLEIWHDDRRSAVARRRQLFERWDECEEQTVGGAKLSEDFGDEGASRIDAIRSEAGRDARERIESFIRRHLPRAGDSGYSTEELEALNRRRRSRARFDPYG